MSRSSPYKTFCELIQYLIDHGADAHLCCHVTRDDAAGTRQLLARYPDVANEIFYEFNAVGLELYNLLVDSALWSLNVPLHRS